MDISFNQKILIIDSDEDVILPLSEYLRATGYICRTAETFEKGRMYLADERFDGIISEMRLTDGNICDLLGDGLNSPVIVLSSDNDDQTVIKALSSGAADYVFKPCPPKVMAARLKVRLPKPENIITYRGLELNKNLRSVLYLGQPIKLTSSEFNILCFLMRCPGKFFTADEIYEKVWNVPSMQTSVVRFHISNLKKTLFTVTGKNIIVSEFGTGYAFAEEN